MNNIDKEPELKERPATEQEIKRRTFIGLGVFVVLQAAAFGSWKWLNSQPLEYRTATAGAKKPLRRALNKTELFFRRLFSNNHLVATYPKELAAKQVRVNGEIGMEGDFNPSEWKMEVIKAPGETLNLTLKDLLALPKTELVYDFKCVEGWDQVQHWGGVKFSDFVHHFGLNSQTAMQYVGFETPDKKYYVGIDMPSALHPQTLLAYEMNDKPLPQKNGAPLRLIIPVKYGIKNLKRISTITFSNTRPRDYWAEQGYDYYSGL
jgi:DMSO/TMAO reductase YedYZ molybdopterin-dependent catalytic subunit